MTNPPGKITKSHGCAARRPALAPSAGSGPLPAVGAAVGLQPGRGAQASVAFLRVAALALLGLGFAPAAAAAGQAPPAAEAAAVDSGGAPPAVDSSGADFDRLLAHLPAASHAVLLVDVARLRAALDAFADRLASSPLFAGHPELAAALAAQRARAERRLAALGAAAGLDPLRDLQRAALGLVWSDPQAPPGMLLVVAGRLPAGLAAALAGGAEPVARRAGVALYAPEPGLRAAMVDGLLLLGHPKQLDAALAADAARVRVLVERLPGLGAPRGAEFMLRLRVELPAWVNAAATAPGQRPLDTLFGSWRRFGLELGAGFAMDAAAADAAGAERLEMVWRAWREMMLGGAYMWRAYALLLLGLDLSQLPGLPPFAQRALADRQALQQTLELVFPAPSGQVRVARQGRSVRLSAPPRMLQGALFVMGIGATIAIPLLLRQLDTAGAPSDRARQALELHNIRAALQTYRVEHGRYPTTAQGLDALVQQGFLRHAPRPAPGRRLRYESPQPDRCRLLDLGSDQTKGGTGPAADQTLLQLP